MERGLRLPLYPQVASFPPASASRGAFGLVDDQAATTKQLLYGGRRGAYPVGGEPNSAGAVPQRDTEGIATAWGSVVRHIKLQVIVAGNGERRQRIGDVLDVGFAVELRLAGRGRCSAVRAA